MRPVIFYMGDLPVPTHDFFVLAGVLAAAVVFFLEARRRNLMSEKLWWLVAGALIVGGITARLSTMWRFLAASPDNSLAAIWLHGGKSVLGGLAGAYAGVLITKRIVGYKAKTGDMFAPAVALGMTIGRWGCFLTEQVGTRTSLPWGITLDAQTAARIPSCPHCAAGVPLHPSFLYEIAFHAVAFVVLLRMRDRVRMPGDLFKYYLLAYGVFRFTVEFVRGNPSIWIGLSGSQLFLLATMPLLVAYFVRQWTRTGTLAEAAA